MPACPNRLFPKAFPDARLSVADAFDDRLAVRGAVMRKRNKFFEERITCKVR